MRHQAPGRPNEAGGGIRAVLFDKDGTLIDFLASWSPATLAVMRRITAGDEDRFRRLADCNHFDLDSGLLRETSPIVAESSADYGPRWAAIRDVPPTPDFFAHMDALFMEAVLRSVTPIGDPAALLRQLKHEGYRLGVVTNDSEIGARTQCDKLGLTAQLDAIIGYDSGHGRKPEAGPILAFARQHGLAPGEIAMVGDTLHDMQAAAAAGVWRIAVLTGFTSAEVLAAHADAVLPDIMALPAYLAGLGRAE
jgi:phosphoglycolate phosphatase